MTTTPPPDRYADELAEALRDGVGDGSCRSHVRGPLVTAPESTPLVTDSETTLAEALWRRKLFGRTEMPFETARRLAHYLIADGTVQVRADAEAAACQAQAERVLAMHRPGEASDTHSEPVCTTCGFREPWPCATVRALVVPSGHTAETTEYDTHDMPPPWWHPNPTCRSCEGVGCPDCGPAAEPTQGAQCPVNWCAYPLPHEHTSGSNAQTSDQQTALREAVADASRDYDKAVVGYEDALATRDASKRGVAETRLSEAERRLSGAQSALIAARVSTHPTFAALLSDPTQQLDPDGEVLRSMSTEPAQAARDRAAVERIEALIAEPYSLQSGLYGLVHKAQLRAALAGESDQPEDGGR